MADKVEKPKKSKPKPKKDAKGVLAALPSTRPERIGTRRVSAPKTFDEPEAAQAAASTGRAKPAARKPAARKPAARGARARTAAAKRSPTPAGGARTTAASRSSARTTAAQSSKPAATRKPAAAARRKAAAPRTFEPTQAAEAAAGAADERAVPRATVPRPVPEPRPRPVREGAPGMGTSDTREQQPAPEHGRPSGVELVTTAVKAAGELTQVGLSIGGRIIKRAVDKLPKP
jgi:hypothetical protein